MNYLYKPATGLWYPVNLDNDGTLQIDMDGGTLTPPPYVASVGECLISTDIYLAYTQTTTLPCTEPMFNLFGVVVSDQIESYCRKSWRISAEAVPVSVQMVTAFVIRDLVVNKLTSTGLYKSYSGGDYSWSLADGITAGDILAPYKSLLAPYRELSVYA